MGHVFHIWIFLLITITVTWKLISCGVQSEFNSKYVEKPFNEWSALRRMDHEGLKNICSVPALKRSPKQIRFTKRLEFHSQLISGENVVLDVLHCYVQGRLEQDIIVRQFLLAEGDEPYSVFVLLYASNQLHVLFKLRSAYFDEVDICEWTPPPPSSP